MGSPNSSDIEAPSSPVRPEKSFVSNIDDGDTTMMDAATPEPGEKASRSKSKASQSKDAGSQSTIGKIRHLKKEDGDPLWRKDIQYDFLKAIFDDEKKVFTNSYEPDKIGKQCFADLYIDTMARSSKTSKVLRDKLLSDRDAAKGMAMVCLLVNIGRMNTTLNFFPEMRAQLRTYHAIPSLQARQDPHAYKQLQDAPRLKSILKGSMEDREEPGTLVSIKEANIPRTNPVSLLFIICAAAQKIAELHFPAGQEFHDLVMKTKFSSHSRAMAFLWLMWFYLESDFTEEGCEENPFGPGVDYGLHVANQGVPSLEEMTAEEEVAENVDTQEELDFGYEKQKMRAKILEVDQAYIADTQPKRGARSRAVADDGPAILPRIRPSKHESDMDSTRSTPPPSRVLARQAAIGSASRRGIPSKYTIIDASSPAGPQGDGVVSRKPRPPTAHQLAVERHRKEQVDHILDRGLRKQYRKLRKLRKQEGAIYRASVRIKEMPDELAFQNSDGEDEPSRGRSHVNKDDYPFRSTGPGGLCQLKSEPDDFGEETNMYCASVRRAVRRLNRWIELQDQAVIPAIKRKRVHQPEPQDLGDDELDGIDDDDIHINGHGLKNGGTPSRKSKKSRAKLDVVEDVDENGDMPMDDGDDPDGDKASLRADDDDEVEDTPRPKAQRVTALIDEADD
ncbi:unnamed protein product [Parascedosporium putredinis]|uniref:INO80 chromatin remodeling complex Ies1 n=1 Tax=Parascedosporium putredinis TaxID=1442378 RepID=A0A9P1M9W8_9PEZI|nr:unnamed protein product [Parascedosporium putredinis]CAI7992882.1 unnamed protein product [Parascedosporium putredinis]